MSYIEKKLVMSKTRHKLGFVRLLYLVISSIRKILGKSNQVQVNRNGINWQLDINEAIDFCIYLTGQYEPELIQAYFPLVDNQNMTIIDIGANMGAHTLTLAGLVGPNTKIYAIEPTEFAYRKLRRNVNLNPRLAPLIKTCKVLLTDGARYPSLQKISASWDISKKISDDNRNQLDGGFECTFKDAKSQTLDQFVEEQEILKVDMIKLDVDGNEIDVLKGARKTIEKFRPALFVELSPIHFDRHRYQFSDLVNELKQLNYRFQDIFGEPIELESEKLEKWIPHGTLVNVLGVPK